MRLSLNLARTPPAPLADPADPDYLASAIDYIVHRWESEAREVVRDAERLEAATDGEWVDDRAERVLRGKTIGISYLRAAWMLKVIRAGRLEDAARGRLVYPQDP